MLFLNGAEKMCMSCSGSTVSRHRHATLVTMEKVLKNIKLREGLGRELRDRDVFDGG